MIHEEICTYEVCKLARVKGFNEKCYHYYQNGVLESDECFNRYNNGVNSVCSAPTQSLLQRWLREEKDLCISVEAYPTLAIMGEVCFAWIVKSRSDGHFIESNDPILTFSTYELALEDALQYALENLI